MHSVGYEQKHFISHRYPSKVQILQPQAREMPGGWMLKVRIDRRITSSVHLMCFNTLHLRIIQICSQASFVNICRPVGLFTLSPSMRNKLTDMNESLRTILYLYSVSTTIEEFASAGVTHYF